MCTRRTGCPRAAAELWRHLPVRVWRHDATRWQCTPLCRNPFDCPPQLNLSIPQPVACAALILALVYETYRVKHADPAADQELVKRLLG